MTYYTWMNLKLQGKDNLICDKRILEKAAIVWSTTERTFLIFTVSKSFVLQSLKMSTLILQKSYTWLEAWLIECLAYRRKPCWILLLSTWWRISKTEEICRWYSISILNSLREQTFPNEVCECITSELMWLMNILRQLSWLDANSKLRIDDVLKAKHQFHKSQ